MDPNTLLRILRDLAQKLLDDDANAYTGNETPEQAAELLAQGLQDLDEWLSKGGFLPAAWSTK